MTRIALVNSSSTKLASFFTALVFVAIALLCYEIYALMHGKTVSTWLTVLTLVLMALVAAGLFVISYYVTKRINRIVATAENIMATRDLSERIPIDGRWDDLSKLSSVLNRMLDDIEQLVAGVKQVSDNISHDLRTPLTRLRNHLESLRNSSSAIAPERLGSLIVECDGLLTTFNALLRISNIEAGKRHVAFRSFDLADIAHDVIELYEPLAGEKSLQLTQTLQSVTVTADKDLLFQAIANLVDNAIKYTPAGGAISITTQALSPRGARITVRDSGVGVADEHKSMVFKRFYRVDSCRVQTGSGLGLSLVQAVIALHQGRIALNDNSGGGLEVVVEIYTPLHK
jgi:signal transduction histidine kinase